MDEKLEAISAEIKRRYPRMFEDDSFVPLEGLTDAGLMVEFAQAIGNWNRRTLAASPAPVIDEAMVERAARAILREKLRNMAKRDELIAFAIQNNSIPLLYSREEARAALAAALGVGE